MPGVNVLARLQRHGRLDRRQIGGFAGWRRRNGQPRMRVRVIRLAALEVAQPQREMAERADFLDQFAMEFRRAGDFAIALRLWNVIDGTQRQRLQADLGVTPRQRRGHDHDQVGLFRQQQRQCGNAVQFRHIDVEHNDVGIGAFDLVDRFTAGAQRGHQGHVGFSFDPPRQQAAHHDGVVHDHDADAPAGGGSNGWFKSEGHWACFLVLTGASNGSASNQINPTSWNLASTISLSNGFMMYSLAPACSARAI